MPELQPNDVRKIAVLRANEVGDFVVILPALEALRRAYPAAEIVLLGRPWHEEFLVPGRSPVDRVIVVPVANGIRREEGEREDGDALNRFFDRMRGEKFDIAVNFQGNGVSAIPFIKQLGARLTAGAASDEAEKADVSVYYYYYQSEIVRCLEIAYQVGALPVGLEPSLYILDTDREEAAAVVRGLKDDPYVLINPVARDFRRMWPLENYPVLADELIANGYQVIFAGSASDDSAIRSILDAMQFSATNACGLTFGGLMALASGAAVTISPDTGPLHLAQAVKCPTVGIYWAPNVINWAPLTRAIHRPVISWSMACPLCGIVPNDPYPFEPQYACKHEVSFVRDIRVADVYGAVEGLIRDQHPRREKATYGLLLNT